MLVVLIFSSLNLLWVKNGFIFFLVAGYSKWPFFDKFFPMFSIFEKKYDLENKSNCFSLEHWCHLRCLHTLVSFC